MGDPVTKADAEQVAATFKRVNYYLLRLNIVLFVAIIPVALWAGYTAYQQGDWRVFVPWYIVFVFAVYLLMAGLEELAETRSENNRKGGRHE